MKATELFDLLRETFEEWSADKAPRLGAALAYYSIFSLAPLLIIAIAIGGLLFGAAAAHGQISAQIRDTIGPTGAQAVEEMLAHVHNTDSGVWATVVGVVTLLIGAAGVFGQLQDALNTIWKVEPKPDRSWGAVIRERFLPFTMVLGTGFLLLVSLILSALLAALGRFLTPQSLPGGAWLWLLLNALLSFGFLVVLFALMYKELPDVRIAWADVWIGAGVTALLFTLGKFLIGLYLGQSSVASAYGAAGSLVLILVWVYYSAQIFLFGAEFTRVYATRHGRRIEPSDNAMLVSPDSLARQGLTCRPGPVTAAS
jgi:membrane protein